MRKSLLVLLCITVISFSVGAAVTLDVYFINVGAGDAILIDCGNWEALLDAGRGYSATNSAVLAVLAEHVNDGIIELAILSHPHADHYGGFEAVLRQYEVREFWRSRDVDPDNGGTTYSRFLSSVADEGLEPKQLERGDRFVSGQIEWSVLGPGMLRTGSTNDNENSLVLLLTYGNVRFLLVGDIESAGESALLDIELPEGPLVLKVAHHGSDTSTSAGFLAWADPELAVLSTGYENPPANTALSRLAIPYCTTSEAGTLRISTDGASIEFDAACLHVVGAESMLETSSIATTGGETLIITEVELNPPGSDSGAEWIEIYNPTKQAILLAGWAASYTGYGGGWDPIPSVIIQPGGYYQFLYPKQHLENSRGGIIQLRNAAWEVVAETPEGLADAHNDAQTWQRFPDGSDPDSLDDWILVNGTPGAAD